MNTENRKYCIVHRNTFCHTFNTDLIINYKYKIIKSDYITYSLRLRDNIKRLMTDFWSTPAECCPSSWKRGNNPTILDNRSSPLLSPGSSSTDRN